MKTTSRRTDLQVRPNRGNGLPGWCGIQLGFVGPGGEPLWSLEAGLGYLFAPLAWLMGIESGDCLKAGELLGIKMATNEFIACQRLGEWLKDDSTVQISRRTQYILTYALSGFSNFAAKFIVFLSEAKDLGWPSPRLFERGPSLRSG